MREGSGRVVAAATDGACSGNPGPGGWGALLRFEDGSVEEFGGYSAATTNNRMELQAALSVLERLQELPCHPDLKIRTDSKYLIDGLGKWMVGWKRKGWRTAAGKPVLNQDLWQALDRARIEGVSLAYVKGHSGDPDNERVDQIAVSFSKGGVPALKSGRAITSKSVGLVEPIEEASDGEDLAPANLQQLLTRLELADRLAEGSYGLSLAELAQLVEQPMAKLERKKASWRWRDWLIEPVDEGRWRLRRFAAGSDQI
ncbi:MAG TPA: ribonuclease H family protein [Prochlorococcus sp.]|nr:ribonuclease H [Prochlorococcaceae cyanobacterium ETNP2_MAG_10]